MAVVFHKNHARSAKTGLKATLLKKVVYSTSASAMCVCLLRGTPYWCAYCLASLVMDHWGYRHKSQSRNMDYSGFYDLNIKLNALKDPEKLLRRLIDCKYKF